MEVKKIVMKLKILLVSVFVVFILFGGEINGEATPQRGSRLRGSVGVTPGPEVSSTSSSQASDGPLSRLRRPTRRTTTPFTTTTALSTTTTAPTTRGHSSTTPISPNQINQSVPNNGFHRQTNSNDTFRQEMIEKLCNRKYGASSSSTLGSVSTTTPSLKKHTSSPKPSTTTTPITTTINAVSQRGVKVKGVDNFPEPQRTVPRNPLLLRRSQAHVRVPRRVRKLTRSTTIPTTTTTTPEASSFPAFPTSKPTLISTTPTNAAQTGTGSKSSLYCSDFDHLTNEQLAKRVKGGIRRKHKPEN